MPLVDARRAELQKALDDLMGAARASRPRSACSGLGGDAPLLGAAEIAFTDLLDAPVEIAMAHGPMAHGSMATTDCHGPIAQERYPGPMGRADWQSSGAAVDS